MKILNFLKKKKELIPADKYEYDGSDITLFCYNPKSDADGRAHVIEVLAAKLIENYKPAMNHDTSSRLERFLNSPMYSYFRDNAYDGVMQGITAKLAKKNKDFEIILFVELTYIANKDSQYLVRKVAKDLIEKYWVEDLKMYKENKIQIFAKYFSNANADDKKDVIGKILNSDYKKEEIDKWLENHEPNLLREMSFCR